MMSEPSANRLRGLVVATKRAAGDVKGPAALLRMGGITLLERQVRLLQAIGVKEVVVLASDREVRLTAEMTRLAKLKMQLVLHTVGQDFADVLPTAPQADWLLLDGSALVDSRLPSILVSQHDERIAVMLQALLLAEDAARGLPLASAGPPMIFAGCARLRSERLGHLCPQEGDGWLVTLLSEMLQDGSAKPVDIATLPTYIPSMRRDVPYSWLPVHGPEDTHRGQKRLMAAAQKGVLDWPARFIHPPIEGWIVKHVCDWPVTPNQVTFLCNVVAFLAAYHFAVGSLRWAILAALSVGVLDGVDGRLARVKQLTSRIGGIVDHVCDAIYEHLWQGAIVYRLVAQGHGTTPYGLACCIIGGAMAEKSLLHLFEKKSGAPLDDFTPFDRAFRLIVGRRNTYMWTLLPFIVFDALYLGYWILAGYALITLLERLGRVTYHLLYRPKPVAGMLKRPGRL